MYAPGQAVICSLAGEPVHREPATAISLTVRRILTAITGTSVKQIARGPVLRYGQGRRLIRPRRRRFKATIRGHIPSCCRSPTGEVMLPLLFTSHAAVALDPWSESRSRCLLEDHKTTIQSVAGSLVDKPNLVPRDRSWLGKTMKERGRKRKRRGKANRGLLFYRTDQNLNHRQQMSKGGSGRMSEVRYSQRHA
nr:hypothetical protein CFP56_65210 [Quercus suber]